MIQVRRLRTAAAFLEHLSSLGISLPFDEAPEGGDAADHFAILPMEGWDATTDGLPTDLVRRRWQRFGESGARLVWGGEAVAVREDGRANPNQLVIGPHVGELRALLAPDQITGLQLTHSGRFAFAEPLTVSPHAVLDRRRPGRLLRDDELDSIADSFVHAARVARDAGFDFVDIKACHGYLHHELLAAVGRVGSRYGGPSLPDRARYLLDIVRRVRDACPDLAVGVRLSVFDEVAYRADPVDGRGVPDLVDGEPPSFLFGSADDLAEPLSLVASLVDVGVTLLCVTAGSPYYCPHVQRPAYFPPSDGYLPPEDPLVGVARLLSAAASVKTAFPALTVVGSGYSYLQEWLPNVAQAVVRRGDADLVGIGRMALSYHDLPLDVRNGRPLDRRRLCRTFSDCTTAPRNGLVSGCWPLDPFYKLRTDRPVLAEAKRASRWQVADA